MDLDGENESVVSDMKPCLIIADTSLDFNAFSAAIDALRAKWVKAKVNTKYSDFSHNEKLGFFLGKKRK